MYVCVGLGGGEWVLRAGFILLKDGELYNIRVVFGPVEGLLAFKEF